MCSTWRAVSRSGLLWLRLTNLIWGRTHLVRDSWHDEYVYWHRTARNFRIRRYRYSILHFDLSDVEDLDGLICRCLTLSDTHLACGFSDGAVRLFNLSDHLHVRTFRPLQRDQLGQFSQAISGIIISNFRLTFASLDGDIHVGLINRSTTQIRRVNEGDVVNDGVLVDFTGCGRWWVGLYSGVPGRTFHIWDGINEELLFVGGSLTDPEAVMGWHMLTDLTEFVGRIRVTSHETAVACTSTRLIVFDLRNQGVILGEQEYRRGISVTSLDVNDTAYVMMDNRGLASVRNLDTLEELCRFTVRGASQRGVMGCMNRGYTLMCAGGVIRIWEVERGEYLYGFRERIGEASALVADERHVAACSGGRTLHLWDFGAQDHEDE